LFQAFNWFYPISDFKGAYVGKMRTPSKLQWLHLTDIQT